MTCHTMPMIAEVMHTHPLVLLWYLLTCTIPCTTQPNKQNPNYIADAQVRIRLSDPNVFLFRLHIPLTFAINLFIGFKVDLNLTLCQILQTVSLERQVVVLSRMVHLPPKLERYHMSEKVLYRFLVISSFRTMVDDKVFGCFSFWFFF